MEFDDFLLTSRISARSIRYVEWNQSEAHTGKDVSHYITCGWLNSTYGGKYNISGTLWVSLAPLYLRCLASSVAPGSQFLSSNQPFVDAEHLHSYSKKDQIFSESEMNTLTLPSGHISCTTAGQKRLRVKKINVTFKWWRIRNFLIINYNNYKNNNNNNDFIFVKNCSRQRIFEKAVVGVLRTQCTFFYLFVRKSFCRLQNTK